VSLMATASPKKYPPYGKLLADRQRFNNLPSLVVVNIGGDCWSRSKKWLNHSDFAALVVPSDLNMMGVAWPVKDCLVLIEWSGGASSSQVVELVKVLLESGAKKVIVSPLNVDYSTPSEYWDRDQQCWIKRRDSLTAYHPWAVT